MIRAGSSAAEVESFIQQNARKYGFMDQTGLSGSVRIGKGEFESYYWKGRTRDFSPYWAKLNIPTLAIYGEEDDFVDALSNERRIMALHNSEVTAKVFPGAGHNLRKANNPAKSPDFDWPRAIDGYPEFVKSWIGSEILK
jgi:pimeloyl-ACP methyl ester carboxylesterase